LCPAGEHRVFHMDYSLLLFYVSRAPFLPFFDRTEQSLFRAVIIDFLY